MKRAQFGVHSNLVRFTERCVALSQKTVQSDPDTPIKKGEGGYADWVIIAIHSLREYLDHTYRQLLEMLQKMPDTVAMLGLSVDELPDFTTVCSRKQDLKMSVWRTLLGLSADLFDSGEYKQ